MKPRSLTIMTATGLISAIAMLAMAQPQRPAASAPGAQRADAENRPERDTRDRARVGLELRVDPEALRIRLTRSIVRAEQSLARNRAALEKLDSGASASEVLAELRSEALSRASSPAKPSDTPEPERDAAPQRPSRANSGDNSKRRNRGEGVKPEEREQMHQFLAEYFPNLWANLQPFLNQDQPTAESMLMAEGLLAQLAPRIREILFLRRVEPELATIKIEQMRVGLDFAEAQRLYRVDLLAHGNDSQEVASAKDRLTQLAEARFDADLRAKRFEISRLKGRLDQLEASVQKIEAKREQEVSHMVNGAILSVYRQIRAKQPSGADASGDD